MSANKSKIKEDEFEALFMANHSRLYYYALSYINDVEACKDIVSDVFEAVWKEYDSIHKATLSSYLYTCTRNRCLDYLRHQCIQQQYADFFIANARQEVVSNVQEYDERLMRIQKAIEAMPPQRQLVLRECYFEKKSYKEVAACMGISTDGVKRHITIALKSLRDIFLPEKQYIDCNLCIAIFSLIAKTSTP